MLQVHIEYDTQESVFTYLDVYKRQELRFRNRNNHVLNIEVFLEVCDEYEGTTSTRNDK